MLAVLLLSPGLVPLLLLSVLILATCAGKVLLTLLLIATRCLLPLRILLPVPPTLILLTTGLLPMTSLLVLVLRLLRRVPPVGFPLSGHLTPLRLGSPIPRCLQTPCLLPAGARPVRPRSARIADLHQGSVVRIPVGGAAR